MKSLITDLQKCAFAFALLFLASSLQSQILGIYEFTGTGTCPQNNTSITAQPANAVFSNFTSVNTTCTASNDVFNNKSWNSSANVDLAEYNEFRIIPGNCHRLNLVSLSFDHKLSTATADWHVRTNLDHFAADIFTGTSTATQSNSLLNFPIGFEAVDTLIVRFYITGISIGTTTWRQDNVALSGTVYSISPVNYYVDSDGDGFGTGNGVLMCSNPGGYALNYADCDDSDPEVNPNSIWYTDLDQDGFGDPEQTEIGCSSVLTNATLAGGDCNDENDEIHPQTVWYEDADADNFGDPQVAETACQSTFLNPVLVAGDCNDSEASVYPGAPEICDEFDNDCNNLVNDGLTFTTYYIDADEDDFGGGSAESFCSDPGVGYSIQNGDCDDEDPAVYPGAAEIHGNGIDENCDGTDGYLGVKELSPEVMFAIFPNPGNEMIKLDLSRLSGTVKINLYTISGSLINSMQVISSSADFTIDSRNLENGIYLIEVESGFEKGILQWVKE